MNKPVCFEIDVKKSCCKSPAVKERLEIQKVSKLDTIMLAARLQQADIRRKEYLEAKKKLCSVKSITRVIPSFNLECISKKLEAATTRRNAHIEFVKMKCRKSYTHSRR